MAIDTLVLGIGNMLWADEGFGIRAVNALNAGWRFPEAVTLMDGGTQGMYLLPYVQAARRMIVFDAIDYRLPPGTLQLIRDGDIPSYLGIGKMSLHQSSFQEVLSFAKLTGQSPQKALLIGVQPELLMDFGGSLTATVRAKLPEALEVALAQLADWGQPGTPRGPGDCEGLADASLAIEAYESGRPSAEEACRIGDPRVLSMRVPEGP